MIKLTCGTSYKSTLNPTDADGRPAPISGVPVWTPQDPSALQITPAADGLSAILTPLKPGSTSFSVSANADVSGDGGADNIADSVNLLIVNEEASHLGIGITPATPEEVAAINPPAAAGDAAAGDAAGSAAPAEAAAGETSSDAGGGEAAAPGSESGGGEASSQEAGAGS